MHSKLLNHWRNQRLTQHRPIKASVELTYRCNERCTHCYLEKYADDQNRKLTLKQWQKVFYELKSGGVLYIDLMGGEAMLHPQFWEILEYCSKLGFYTGMITNGLLINSVNAHKLKTLGLQNATLSLYSLNPQIHDCMTAVKGSFNKTMIAIENLQDQNIPISLNCLLTKDNIDTYFELEDWCKENKIQISPDPNITPKMNNDPAPLKFRASKDQLKKYFTTIAQRLNRAPQLVQHQPEDFVCGAGKLKCAVTVYGELLTCLDIRDFLGSLVTHPFNELWNSPKAQKWRNIKVSDIKGLASGPCGSCDHCPGAALQELQTPFKLPPYTQVISEIKKQVHDEFEKQKDLSL